MGLSENEIHRFPIIPFCAYEAIKLNGYVFNNNLDIHLASYVRFFQKPAGM